MCLLVLGKWVWGLKAETFGQASRRAAANQWVERWSAAKTPAGSVKITLVPKGNWGTQFNRIFVSSSCPLIVIIQLTLASFLVIYCPACAAGCLPYLRHITKNDPDFSKEKELFKPFSHWFYEPSDKVVKTINCYLLQCLCCKWFY